MAVTAYSQKPDEAVALAPFKKLLLRTCGHSFDNDREQALSTGLSRRMAALDIAMYGTYHALLLRDQDELLRLTELLTVNETYFFREPDHLSLMADKLLPPLITGRNNKPVRILSAGCSTGEEPYSIAIMLRERYGADCERLFAITGVDIDSSAIAAAKQGVYGKGSFRGMDQDILERYFQPGDSGKFQVGPAVRKQVGFEVVNLLGAHYPERMLLPDIIFYRNVSIYFPQEVQREIFGRLAGLLGENGCLLVGAAETFHHDIGILSLVELDSIFFYRKTPTLVFEERRTESRHAAVPKLQTAGSPSKVPNPARRTITGHTRSQGGNVPGRAEQPHPVLQQDIRDRFDTALKLAHDKRSDEALGILEAIIAQAGSFSKAYTLKGSLLLSASRFDEAREVCDQVVKLDPLCLEAYLMLGIIERHEGKDDDAFRRFREALYLNPSCWVAHFYTAELLFAQKDSKRAKNSYETALRIIENGSLKELGQAFFPLSFNAEHFMVICRHKLSLLAPKKV